ncbi:mycofactocin biosynthesis glycosyltransferase MftF [Nocardioides sp. WS12]|uniref:mycofactocin biosynthesis glycosyltransferase MftF n=1 Tax=Nocardioides sp. WS12 TaxID=2486272 RepID=UPI0015F78E04|nr:mycofactocin biosynthesis glycosyltransferase MftF [Nocardioides sp. WS12]
MDVTLPTGFGFALASRVRICDDGAQLVADGRVVRLAPAARRLVEQAPLSIGGDRRAGDLARLLLDRGLADPWWPSPPQRDSEVDDVTVVIPTRDRADAVARLLAELPPHLPVVVVDDGSRDPSWLAQVVTRAGARLVRLPVNLGPAAARNAGLRAATTPYVVFCDSDVLPVTGWLGTLHRHFADPSVAVVAPRVRGQEPTSGDGWLDRYEQARSSLDLGPHPAAVRIHGAVAYLPSAFLVVRRSAFDDPAVGGAFDERMRAGEDVDLVWRVLEANWRVRYEPAAEVRHDHRTRLLPWLARKAFYGTSAAPLAARHPSAVAPVVLTPTTAVLSVALLAQRRWSVPVAAAALAYATAKGTRRLGASDRPVATAGTLALEGAVASCWQSASSLTRHHWPIAAVWALRSPRGRRALLVAAVAEAVADRARVHPDLDPLRYGLAHRLDDLAYGAGVWWGALRQRSPRALLPHLRWRRTPR